MTDAELINRVAATARAVDAQFPGLRETKSFEWITRVVAAVNHPRVGHSSSHSDERVTRRNECGLLPEGVSDIKNGRQAYTSINLFQIDGIGADGTRDPMRERPILEQRTDFWFKLDGSVAPAPTPSPTPAPKPAPGYPGDVHGAAIGTALFADYAEAKHPANAGMGVWFFRCAWVIAHEGQTPAQAIARYQPEWRKALGL